MTHIAILMTVHNRREKTIRCLQHLLKQDVAPSVQWHLYLTDDGCTDGTASAIKQLLPEVTVIQGDGNLYWNRGMYQAWQAATANHDYDFYLWLNDDTMLLPSAISHLLACSEQKGHQAIIAGCISSTTKPYVTTYGGRTKKDWISCTGTMQPLRLMHGNTVLIPRAIYNKVGMNDPYYRHAFGDYDYALTAYAQGIPVFSTAQFVGRCDIDHHHPPCFDSHYPVKQRFAHLYATNSYFHPIDAFHFDRKHNGLFIAIARFIHLHTACLLPFLWR